MIEIIIKIIAGVISTVGFAIIFRVRPKHIPCVALDGFIACVVYFVSLEIFNGDLFVSNILASLACAGFAEVFAKIDKAPSTIFLLPGCIALVPGGSLYQAMRNLMLQDYNGFGAELVTTLKVGIAIAGGIIAVSIIRYFVNKINEKKARTQIKA